MSDEETLPPFPAREQIALEAIVERLVTEQGVPGAVAGVWISGRGAWTHAHGIGDLRTAAPISIDGHVRIASVSKTFVATVVLQLVDEGTLSLEDTLEQYVPGIPNGERITIRQVLGMTAGIFNYINDPAFEEAYVSDPLMPFAPREAVEIVKRHPHDFPPGEQVRYSDSNYILAGLIIERLAGKSAVEAVTERIIQPLGLAGTSFPTTPRMPTPHPRGYGADPGSPDLRDITESNPDVAWTAGAMISTLEDLRVWARALAAGTLLSSETQRERLRFAALPAAPGMNLGYGLGIMDLNGFVGHAGAIFGYSTWMLHSTDRDATIVVLANRGETETEFASKIAVDIARLLFPKQFPLEASAAAKPAP